MLASCLDSWQWPVSRREGTLYFPWGEAKCRLGTDNLSTPSRSRDEGGTWRLCGDLRPRHFIFPGCKVTCTKLQPSSPFLDGAFPTGLFLASSCSDMHTQTCSLLPFSSGDHVTTYTQTQIKSVPAHSLSLSCPMLLI